MFSGAESEKDRYHGIRFLFPDDADRFTVTFVVGRPPGSQGYLTFSLKRPGVKWGSKTYPGKKWGAENERRVYTTYQESYAIQHGGKGAWWTQINPHFDRTILADKSLKYGCVITVESSKHLDIHRAINRWMSQQKEVQEAVPSAVQLESLPRRSRRAK